ncbi:MAG: hypothetical protein ACP5PT_02495 [Brevinematia bacterium]
MRKPIVIGEAEGKKDLQDLKVEAEKIQNNLYEYLTTYIPKEPSKSLSKSSIMGPVGKLLAQILAKRFGNNVEPYVGFTINVHRNMAGSLPSKEAVEKLSSAVQSLLDLSNQLTERDFARLINLVDYGVYFKKCKDIAERIEAKRDKESEVKNE